MKISYNLHNQQQENNQFSLNNTVAIINDQILQKQTNSHLKNKLIILKHKIRNLLEPDPKSI